MNLTVDELLAGPRGRRLCLEIVLHEQETGTPAAELWTLLFYATYRLATARGQGGTLLGTGADEPLPDPSVDEVAAALTAVPISVAQDVVVLAALGRSVGSARYWQEQDGTDELLGLPGMRTALEANAALLLAAPATTWWGAVTDEQWRVEFVDDRVGDRPRPSASEALHVWRAETQEAEARARRWQAKHPKKTMSGEWWSTPPGWLTASTRILAGVGPLGLYLVEDAMGWSEALIERVRTNPTLRILELTGAEVWADICRRYPLDVTASRRHDWYRSTGRSGLWVIPDWSQVATEFDAVHLPISTYLSSAGTAIPVTDEAASVIAGWNPDETVWLTDVPVEPGTQSSWSLDEDTGLWQGTPA